MNTQPNINNHINPPGQASGPKTPEGKRIAARNATTHGLFARDVVLPQLGESPEAYHLLLQEIGAQIRPTNLLERHYTEKIAAASWRLRRLHRWQAQLFEDDTLSEDEVMLRLDRVLRHETALHRQIDGAVKMIGREVPNLFENRARRLAQAELHITEQTCRQNPNAEYSVVERARQYLPDNVLPEEIQNHGPLFDNIAALAKATPPAAAEPAHPEKCQNEPAPSEPSPSSLTPPELGVGGRSSELGVGGRSSHGPSRRPPYDPFVVPPSSLADITWPKYRSRPLGAAPASLKDGRINPVPAFPATAALLGPPAPPTRAPKRMILRVSGE